MAWQYTGLNAEELEGRITTSYERVLTTTVDNIQHIESTTVNGQAIIKVFLQPNARLDTANAQITAISQTVLRQFPPGTRPPLIINYSASSVPILQLGAVRRRARRAAALRSRRQLPAAAARDDPGRGHSVSRSAASSARSWST